MTFPGFMGPMCFELKFRSLGRWRAWLPAWGQLQTALPSRPCGLGQGTQPLRAWGRHAHRFGRLKQGNICGVQEQRECGSPSIMLLSFLTKESLRRRRDRFKK